MSTTAQSRTTTGSTERPGHAWVRGGAVVLVGSLVLGAVTSWAQGFLPAALAPLANSSSGWTICTALLVAAARPTVRQGAVLGPVGFVCLVLGYTLASHVRGLSYDPTLWAAIGVVAGPFIGASVAATFGRAGRLPAALGSGLLSGVLVGDGVFGLTVIASSTSPVYWTVVLVGGLVLLVATAVARLREPGAVALQVGACVATAAAFLLAYLTVL